MPDLTHIYLFPIKSLDGISTSQATVLPSGALFRDREFAMFDNAGKFVNGKRNAKVHQLRSQFDWDNQTVSLQIEGGDRAQVFSLSSLKGLTDRSLSNDLNVWLSNYFEMPVKLEQNREMGFPDDTASPGPTIISTATIEALCNWFPGISVAQMRRRLRTNLEIGGVPAFWEEQLYADDGETVRFKIGDVELRGINPCQRCVVPTRDPITGEAYASFQKVFTAKRKQTLPSWAARSRFNHFYRIAVNTRIHRSEAGKILQVGNSVEIMD